MARQPKTAPRRPSVPIPPEPEAPIFRADGRYHGLPRRSRGALAFNLLLLAPVWILSAVISPLVPGVIFAGILALAVIVMSRDDAPARERRLAAVAAVISANALLIGLCLWRIQMTGPPGAAS